jgi:hypothetical protein
VEITSNKFSYYNTEILHQEIGVWPASLVNETSPPELKNKLITEILFDLKAAKSGVFPDLHLMLISPPHYSKKQQNS